jgi:hypothetical protein
MYAPTRLEGPRILAPPTPGTQAEIALPSFRIGAALPVPELRQAITASGRTRFAVTASRGRAGRLGRLRDRLIEPGARLSSVDAAMLLFWRQTGSPQIFGLVPEGSAGRATDGVAAPCHGGCVMKYNSPPLPSS